GLMQKLHEGAEGHDKRYHEHLLEQLHRLQQDNNPLMQPQQLEAVKALKDMIDNKAFHGMGQDLDVTQGQHELLEKLHADHLDAAKVSAKKAAAEKKERKAAAEKRPARADANDDEVRAMIDDLRAEMADIRKLMQELRGKVKQAQASGSGAASGHAGHGAAAGASGLLGGVQPGPFGRAGILLGGQDTFSGGAAAGTGSGAFDLFPAGSGTGSTDQPGGIGGSAVHGTEGSTSAGGNGSHDQFTRGFAGSTPAGAGSGGGR
ncbi:MAG TPA: hypothetical protein VK348_15960, partial [Planctomycetota bacterium]|nr:hypothetical protein [Planctomycetota bacterium]